jgi:hypothetical protein
VSVSDWPARIAFASAPCTSPAAPPNMPEYFAHQLHDQYLSRDQLRPLPSSPRSGRYRSLWKMSPSKLSTALYSGSTLPRTPRKKDVSEHSSDRRLDWRWNRRNVDSHYILTCLFAYRCPKCLVTFRRNMTIFAPTPVIGPSRTHSKIHLAIDLL